MVLLGHGISYLALTASGSHTIFRGRNCCLYVKFLWFAPGMVDPNWDVTRWIQQNDIELTVKTFRSNHDHNNLPHIYRGRDNQKYGEGRIPIKSKSGLWTFPPEDSFPTDRLALLITQWKIQVLNYTWNIKKQLKFNKTLKSK